MTVNPIQAQKYLGGMEYPASRDELVEHARSKGADDELVKTLSGIDDQQYETPAEVSKALGGSN